MTPATPARWRRRALRHITTGLAAVALLGSCATTLSREQLAVEYYNIGTAYFDLGELEKSATYLSRAIDLSPELARGSYNLARVYVLQERYEDALALLDQLLDEDPDNALVIETIAYAHYESGDLRRAAEWYDRAAEVNPTDPELLQNRADVAVELGDVEAALDSLRQALRLVEDDPELTLRLARAERESGNAPAALDAYEHYLELEPSPVIEALFSYAELLEQEAFYADAIAVFERIGGAEDASSGDQALAHFERGRLLLTAAQEADDGIDAIRSAVTLGFDDEEAFAALLAEPGLRGRADLEELGVDAGLIEAFDPEANGAGEGPDATE